MRNNKKFISIKDILILTVTLIGYIYISQMDNPAIHFEQYLIIILPVYIAYFYLVLRILKTSISGFRTILIFLAFGFIFRIILIGQDPWLSNDVYRYLWDGQVSAETINPYTYPPNHEQLKPLQDSPIFTQINFPEIATVYPPVSQFFFWLNYHLGNSLHSWKMILIVFEVFLTLILLKLLGHFKINNLRVLIFTLNPLVIIETYMNGHLEIIALLFLWIAIYLFYNKQNWWSTLMIIPAFLTKFLPLLIFIPFNRPKFFKKIVIISGISAIIIFPFTLSDTIPMSGFLSYANRWSFNGAVFKIITSFIYMLPVKVVDLGIFNFNEHFETVYLNQEFYYKLFAMMILLFVVIDQYMKSDFRYYRPGIRPLSAAFIITGSFLLLTPTLHPWYILWIIPFMIFVPRWSWLLFTLLIQLSYQVLRIYQTSGIWEEQIWILLFEYVPFYGLMIWEYMDRRKINGWLL